jgi:hypothetical protein
MGVTLVPLVVVVGWVGGGGYVVSPKGYPQRSKVPEPATQAPPRVAHGSLAHTKVCISFKVTLP